MASFGSRIQYARHGEFSGGASLPYSDAGRANLRAVRLLDLSLGIRGKTTGSTRWFWLVFAFLSLGIGLSPLFGQWQPDVRLTFNDSQSTTSENNAYCVAAGGSGTIHVVWCDNRDQNSEIYYKRSSDSGLTWSSDTRLTSDSGSSSKPTIAASGSNVHAVWEDDRDGYFAEIYYKHSSNYGLSWSADTRLTFHLTDPQPAVVNPSVAASGSCIHVVWTERRDGNHEVYYKRSSDGGSNWSADMRLTNDTAYSEYPSVAVSGDVIHVVWMDHRSGHTQIYYKKSTDAGLSWSSDVRLTNTSTEAQYPIVACYGSNLHVTWSDYRDFCNEIYYKRSTDAGVTWLPDVRLTNDTTESWYPSVAASGTYIHVVWCDYRDANAEIYYKRSSDGGVGWSADTRLTVSSALSEYPSVAVLGQCVHVVWDDKRDGNKEIYYKRNPTGGGATAPHVWTTPPGFSLALQQNQSKDTILVIGNSGDAELVWSLARVPDVSWLSATPTRDSTSPGTQKNATVSINTDGLSPDTYLCTLRVTSNDSASPQLDVPVALNVAESTGVYILDVSVPSDTIPPLVVAPSLLIRIMSQICGYVQTAVVLCKVSVTRPVMRNLAFQ